jgi:hypothetical protein
MGAKAREGVQVRPLNVRFQGARFRCPICGLWVTPLGVSSAVQWHDDAPADKTARFALDVELHHERGGCIAWLADRERVLRRLQVKGAAVFEAVPVPAELEP